MKILSVLCVLGFLMAYGSFSKADTRINDEGIEFFSNSAGDRFYYDEPVEYGGPKDSVATVRMRAVSGRTESAVKEMSEVLQIDCEKKTYRKVSSETITRDGTAHPSTKSGEWTDIHVGTAIAPLSEKVCKKSKIQ
jgi:hypothetical protein